MLKIKPIYNSRINCLDNIIANIAANENSSYQLALSDSWNLEYNNNLGETIGKKIGVNSVINFKNLYKLHGIQTIPIEMPMDTNYLISDWNNRIYYCANVDTYNCQWDKCYNVHHNLHSIIVEKINIYENSVYITDPFYGIYMKNISFTDYNNMVKSGFIFYICNRNSADLQIVKDIIKQRMLKLETEIENISLIMKAIAKINIKKEINNERNVWHSEIVYKVGRISLSRTRYIEFLDYIVVTYGMLLNSQIKQLYYVSKQWKSIQMFLAKIFLKNDANEINYITDKLRMIQDIENNVRIQISNIINSF